MEQLINRNDCRRRILVVDDEPLIADSLALILSDNGFETIVAYGGVDALTKAETLSPELLLTDVVMPDLDGIQLAFRLVERWPACKVLFISGHLFGFRYRS